MPVIRPILFAVLLTTAATFAQSPPTARSPGGDSPPGNGSSTRSADGTDVVKVALKASDEEWKVLSPAIRKVANARRTAEAGLVVGQPMGGRGGRFGGRGGGPGGMGNDAFGGPAGPGGWRRPGGDGGPGRGGPPGNEQADGQANRPPSGETGGPAVQGGPGGPPGMNGGPVAAAMADLKVATDGGHATEADIAAKIAAVRATRQKARDDAQKAAAELKELVTPEQEAVLIAAGYLE